MNSFISAGFSVWSAADDLEREAEEARQRAGQAAAQVEELQGKLRAASEEIDANASRVAQLEAQLVEALAAAGRCGGRWGVVWLQYVGALRREGMRCLGRVRGCRRSTGGMEGCSALQGRVHALHATRSAWFEGLKAWWQEMRRT